MPVIVDAARLAVFFATPPATRSPLLLGIMSARHHQAVVDHSCAELMMVVCLFNSCCCGVAAVTLYVLIYML